MSRAARDRQLRRDTPWDRSPLGRAVADREEARAAYGRVAKTMHSALLDGLAELHDWFTWLATEYPSRPEVGALLQGGGGANMDVIRGAEAALAVDPWAASDSARHLMEIEMLLVDFTHEPDHVSEWLTANHRSVLDKFAFGRTRTRHEQRLGLPERRFLPDRAEYSMHSATVHPVPPDLQEQFLPTPWDELSNLLGDLFGHAWRVWRAALTMLADVEPEVGRDAPGLNAIGAAEEFIVHDLERFPAAYSVRPAHEAGDWRAERAARLADELAVEHPDSGAA